METQLNVTKQIPGFLPTVVEGKTVGFLLLNIVQGGV